MALFTIQANRAAVISIGGEDSLKPAGTSTRAELMPSCIGALLGKHTAYLGCMRTDKDV